MAQKYNPLSGQFDLVEPTPEISVPNIEDIATTSTNGVTGRRFWTGINKFISLAWTWALKQTFTTAPTFSSTTASQILEVDGSKGLISAAKGTAYNKAFGTGATDVCVGNDARLTDSRTPAAHGASHTNGGDDIQDATSLQKGLLTSTDWSTFNGKEPSFSKNTAFNKAFGTAAGTVCEGNDARLSALASSAVTLPKITGATYFTVEDMGRIFHSAGNGAGGAITDAGSGQVQVASGTGWIRITNDSTDALLAFDYPAIAPTTITDGLTKFVKVSYNGGTPTTTLEATDNFNNNNEFGLGVAIREGSVIHTASNAHNVGDHAGQMIERVHQTNGIKRDNYNGGLILGQSGDANKRVTLSSGALWSRLNRFPISAINTGTGGTYDRYYQTAPTTFTKEAAVTAFNNTYWNNGTALVALGTNKWTNCWFYLELDGSLVSMYGRGEYSGLPQAQAASAPTALPPRLNSEHAILIGRMSTQQGNNVAVIQSMFDIAFSQSAVINHNDTGSLNTGDYQHLTQAWLTFLTAWHCPTLTLGDVIVSGTSAFANTGAGYYLSFSGTADDSIYLQVYLVNNGIAYDGSNLAIKLCLRGSTTPSGGDTVGWLLDYAFIRDGDNAMTTVTNVAQQDVVITTATDIVFDTTLTTMTGLSNAHILQVTLTRNSTGASADSYAGNIRLMAIELVKV